jgi:hypothetical protein
VYPHSCPHYLACKSYTFCVLLHCHMCQSLAPPYFSTLSHKWHHFGRMLLSIKCVYSFSLQLLPEIFSILRRIQQENIMNISRYARKVSIILVILQWNFHFIYQIFKKSYNIKFNEYLISGSSAVPCRTDMTKLMATFCSFVNIPQKSILQEPVLQEMVQKYQSLYRNINKFIRVLSSGM